MPEKISVTQKDIDDITTIIVHVPQAIYGLNQTMDGWAGGSQMRKTIWRNLGITVPPYPSITIEATNAETFSMEITGPDLNVKAQLEQELSELAHHTFSRPNV